jgi:hypothetical protein
MHTLNPNPKAIDLPEFAHDGKAIVYPVREKGSDNLWLQPLDVLGDDRSPTFRPTQSNSLNSPLLARISVFSANTMSQMWCYSAIPTHLELNERV